MKTLSEKPNDKVRILINGIHARSGGGVTYLQNILTPLADDERLQLYLCLHRDQLDLFGKIDNRVQVRVFDVNRAFWSLFLWEQISLPLISRRMAVDVTFSPANFGPIFARNPVIMLRNALAVGDEEPRFARRLYWMVLALMTAASLMGCRRAIAVSNYARDALSFGVTGRLKKKVQVVYHGVNPIFSPAPKETKVDQFLLVVADIYIQKNLHTLMEALPKILGRFPDLRLKIAGRRNDEVYYSRIVKLIARLGLEDHVLFLGHKRDDELITLYRECAAFVLPSTVETFGNPLAEAMACGAPVVCSNTAALPEIVGDGALLFDPLNAEDMANKIISVIADEELADRITRLGRERSKIFSWQRTAKQTADTLVEAAWHRVGGSVPRKGGRGVKVLINAISAKRGGIVTYTSDLVNELRARHVDATIALPPSDVEEGSPHTMVVDVRTLGAVRRFLWDQFMWRSIVKGHETDVLFSSANFGLLSSPVSQLLMMSEGGLFNPLYLRHVMPRLGKRFKFLNWARRVLMLRSIKAASIVILPTETLYKWILSYCPDLENRAVINGYGIDLDRFKPQSSNSVLRDDGLRLLYVSVYYPHKDPETLNRAVQILRKQGIDVSAHITMAEEEFMRWKCGPEDYKRLRDSERKGFLNLASIPHKDLPAAYGACDIFVFPSVSETFGFPLVEAMACGSPVIAADTLTNREICGSAALYYPPFDADGLANQIKNLRAQPDLYRKMREAGIERAHNRFSLTDHFDRLAELVDQMATGQDLSHLTLANAKP